MAILRITEFAGLGSDPNGSVQAPSTPPVNEQAVAIGGSSTQSVAFTPTTQVIRVSCDVVCAVYVGGVNPVAVQGVSARFAAGQTEYFGVTPGHKLAVISDT